MQDQITGNITLNRADTFSIAFSYKDEDGSLVDLNVDNVRFHVGQTDKYLFSLSATPDPNSTKIIHFTFTAVHADALGKKEWDWIIRDDSIEDILAEGATIQASGFAVPQVVKPL